MTERLALARCQGRPSLNLRTGTVECFSVMNLNSDFEDYDEDEQLGALSHYEYFVPSPAVRVSNSFFPPGFLDLSDHSSDDDSVFDPFDFLGHLSLSAG